MKIKYIHSQQISGEGLADSAYNVVKTVASAVLKPDLSINQLYPKEQHGILKLPNGKYAYANYMGPGTRLDIRVPRGDVGLTPIDKESEAHDLRYNLLHKDAKSKEEAMNLARQADIKFNQKIDEFRKNKSEPEINLKQAELIKLKVFLEKNKALHDLSYKFTSPDNEKQESPELDQLYRRELNKLEQQGYGRYNPFYIKYEF